MTAKEYLRDWVESSIDEDATPDDVYYDVEDVEYLMEKYAEHKIFAVFNPNKGVRY